jgi:glycosyltransferase involved in cell wall biosynthesis
MDRKFSLLISLYRGENPDYFRQSMESIMAQTFPPAEIVLVKDGPLTQPLEGELLAWKKRTGDQLRILVLEENVGLGKSLQYGLEYCTYEIVARADTDDICREDRFEQQIKFMDRHRDVDVLGSWVAEFEESITNILGQRKVPLSHDKIVRYARFRNPLNHPTVVFRKAAVRSCGSYLPFPYLEDYYLWVRMILAGKRFANIPENLLLFNVRHGTFARRGGPSYLMNEIKLQRYFLRTRFINLPIFLFNVSAKSLVRLLPTQVRKTVYRSLLRKRIHL